MALGVGHLSGRELDYRRGGIRVDTGPLLFRLWRPGPRAVPLNLGCIWHIALTLCLLCCFAHGSVSLSQKYWLQPIFHRSQPLGGWASVLIVSLIGLQATSGLFISDDIFHAGPYNSAVSSRTADALAGWHHRFFNLIQITLVLHLAAVSWHTWGLKERLI